MRLLGHPAPGVVLMWATCACVRVRRQAEIAEFEAFARQDRVHDAIFERIAPNIFGADDIKKAVACLLMGGSRKVGAGVGCGLDGQAGGRAGGQ